MGTRAPRRYKNPGVRPRNLELDLNTALRTEVRPNPICPFPTLIDPNSFSLSGDPHPSPTEGIPCSPRILQSGGYQGRILRAHGHRAFGIMSSKNKRPTCEFSFNVDTAEVPTIGICGACSKAQHTAQCSDTSHT